MRAYLSILLFAIVGLCIVHGDEPGTGEKEVEFYSDKYDDVDFHDILQNDRLRDQYYKCMMDMGPCVTPDAIHFKNHLPEAFATKCKKCTQKQKDALALVADWYTQNRPEEWDAFVQKLLKDAKKLNAEA